MNNIWIKVYFDGQPIDNVMTSNIENAKDLIKIIEKNGFEEYNEAVKYDWLKMGFKNNPKVTATITQ